MSKISKKGRNPGAVDNWLDTLGLYRKNVAYDETCLFRAVSEQLFDCQVYHERVRKECILYARENYEQFADLVSSETEWNDHLSNLEKHMVFCGDVELNIISKKYNRDVILFDASKQHVVDFTKRHLPNVFLLCLMDRDHFDVVYKREHITSAGFCQSIVYKILYENVFKIPDVDEIVNNMLYDKNILTPCEVQTDRNEKFPDCNESVEKDSPFESDEKSTNIAPFPFKVAKALDPNIYRNIEYDSWGELRREMRLGEWYYGDDKLILGTKCIYKDPDSIKKYDCYIQEILEEQKKCVIFLTKVAEKKTVDYASLSPEDDAKPWPLPYRFMKNCVISNSTTNTPAVEKALKPKRKYKDKKRTKSESSIISSNVQIKSEVENVEDYVGIPLQMQNSPPYCHPETPSDPQTEPAQSTQEPTSQPEAEPSAHPHHRLQQQQQPFEAAQWQPYLTTVPDQFVWPQSPAVPQSVFSFKPMVASAPVTPNVVPYHDPNYPYYYNYHVEPFSAYPQWSSPPPFELQPPPPPKNEVDKPEPPRAAPQPPAERVGGESAAHRDSGGCAPAHERPPPLTFAPPSPSVEVYPQMVPMHPGTPVLYAAGPPEMTEVVMPPTPIMYTPHMEIPYMPPSPFIYPPTPPPTWYPAGVTPQGFFFPSRHT